MKRYWLLIFALPLALADFLLPGGPREFWWSGLVGFFALFGLVACLALIVVSKALGHYWLERPEDYYASSQEGEESLASLPSPFAKGED